MKPLARILQNDLHRLGRASGLGVLVSDRSAGRAKASCTARRSNGFTLVEIMLAIAIFAFVLLAIYNCWIAILRGANVGAKVAAEAQRTRITMRALEEALGSAMLYGANVPYYSFIADTSEEYAMLSFVSRLPASFPGSGLFGDQVVRRVEFSVENGPDSRPQMVLRQKPLLEPFEADAKPYTIVLAPEVSLFQVEFFDTNRLEWVPEWLLTNQLPRMVRVALSFGERSQNRPRAEETSIQTVHLASSAIPRQLQVPGIRPGIPGGPGGPGGVPPPGNPAPVVPNNPRTNP